jgi:hypothetical protein
VRTAEARSRRFIERSSLIFSKRGGDTRGAGYVTDVNYVPGYYAEQSPVYMVSAARLAGVACDMPDDDDPVHYLELGCGRGLVALTLAASNPR